MPGYLAVDYLEVDMELEPLDGDLLVYLHAGLLTYEEALAEQKKRVDRQPAVPTVPDMQEEQPLYIDTVRAMVEGDIEHVEQLLSELERGKWMPYIRANLSQAALDLRRALERLQEAQGYEEKR